MTEAEKKRDEILKFLQAWDAEQVSTGPGKIPDDPDPVVRALQFFPVIALQ